MTDNSLAQRGDMLTINMPAPDFVARTTMGERRLSSYRGRWLVLFSHPADFTPVCTSEFIAFAGLQASFADIGCDLLALSVDSLYSHVAWVRSIRDRFGVGVNFPIAEDPSMAIAAAYGMIPPDAGDSSTVRASFVIDPDGIVRAITWYPMAVGRNVSEILRLVVALLIVATAVPAILAIFGSLLAPLDILNHLQLLLFFGTLLALVLALAVRMRRWAVLLGFLGLCASGPSAMLDGEPMARLTAASIQDIAREVGR